jgi:hypothetical protein
MNKINGIIITIAAVLAFSACDGDFLNRYPEDRISSGDFYNTAEEMRLATAPLYTQVWFLFNDKAYFELGDARAGNFNAYYDPESNEHVMLNNNPLRDKLREAWQSFYTVVAHSNIIINAINEKQNSNVSEADKNAALSEAKFMRATAYFYLVRLWGPVLIIENNIEITKMPIVPLHPVEDVYRFIMEDLEFAAQWLPEKDVPARVTKWTAKGMLAKVYLTYSGYNGAGSRKAEYLEKAVNQAKEVCENSETFGYQLMTNYADLFFAKNNNNSESLFALQWNETSEFWGQGNTAQAYLASENFSKASDGWNMFWASYDMLAAYEATDTLRRNATFMTAGTHYPELYKSNGGYTHTNTEQASCKKYIIGSTEDAGVAVYRMSAPIATYMLRLADVYLTYAESILGNSESTTDPEALKYFNKVRQRAGLPAKTSITLDDIYHERRIEFAVEGQFWYDLVARYYFQPEVVLDFMNSQHRGAEYTYTKINGVGVAEITSEQEFPAVAKAESMRLPYPEVEVISNPLLKENPVPYNFK